MTFIWPSYVSLFKAFSWTLSIHCTWISALYFATSPQEVGPAPGTQRAPAASVACRRRSVLRPQIQLISGHESKKSMEVYQHLSLESVDKAYQDAVQSAGSKEISVGLYVPLLG